MLTLDQIQPTQDRVLIAPDPVPDVTAGGIHIPEVVNADNPNYYTMTGTVLAVGPGARDAESGERLEMPVTEGDRVVFGRYAGKQIEVEGCGRLLVMRASDLLGHTDAKHVQPGYQAPKFGPIKGTAAPASSAYRV